MDLVVVSNPRDRQAGPVGIENQASAEISNPGASMPPPVHSQDAFVVVSNPEPADDVNVVAGVARSFLGQGLAFGFGDEIEAKLRSLLNGTSFEDEVNDVRREIRRFAEANPALATGSEIVGSLAGALLPGGAIAKGGSVLGRMGKGALLGGAFGGLGGLGQAEGTLRDRLPMAKDGAKLGAGLGALGPAVGHAATLGLQKAGLRGLPPLKRFPRKDAPKLEDLESETFSLLEKSPVEFKSRALLDLERDVHSRIAENGTDPRLLTGTRIALRDIRRAVNQSKMLSMQELMKLRRTAHNVFSDGTNGDKKIAPLIIDRLDDFILGLEPKMIRFRTKEAIEHFVAGQRQLSRLRRFKVIKDLAEKAEADAKNDFGFQLRNKFRELAGDPQRMRFFEPAEQEAINLVARDKKVARALQKIKSSEKGVAGIDGLFRLLGGIANSMDSSGAAALAMGVLRRSVVVNAIPNARARADLDRAEGLIGTGEKIAPGSLSSGNDALLTTGLLGLSPEVRRAFTDP